MISITDLKKNYDTKTFSLEIEKVVFPDSGLFLLVGPSGCGKTTLLDLISGLTLPDSGTILFDGKETRYDTLFYRNVLTYVQVENNVFNGLTVRQNLFMASSDRERATEIGESFGLDPSAKASCLSKGESERLALACGILKDTPILLVDEPTANLDEETSVVVLRILKEFSRNHLVIVATHDLDLFENMADGRLSLSKGRLIQESFDKKVVEGKAHFEKDHGKPIKSPLLSLGLHKAFSGKIAYFSTTILLFLAFFSCFLGSNFYGFDQWASLSLALEDKEIYVCRIDEESLSPAEESLAPCLAVQNSESGKYAIYLDKDIQPFFKEPLVFPDDVDNDEAIPLLIDSSVRSEIDAKEGLSSEIGNAFPLESGDLDFVIAGYFDSGNVSSFPMAIASSKAYREYVNENVSLFGTDRLAETLNRFYDGIGIDERERDTYFSTLFKECASHSFFPSKEEAEANYRENGGSSYYLLGRLPESEDEIVVNNGCVEEYFFGAEKELGEDFLKEEGEANLVIDFMTPENAYCKTMTHAFKIVGCYGVVDGQPNMPLPCLVQDNVLESLGNELVSLRAGFPDASFSSAYLQENGEEVLDGKIDILGLGIQNVFPFIQGQARTMWVAISLSLFAVAILIALLYLITIQKELAKENILLVLWGFRKEDRLLLYLCSILAILLPPFLLALVLSPSLFHPIVHAIYSAFPGTLVFSYGYGFLSLVLSLVLLVLLFLLPLLVTKGKKHGRSN